MGKRRDLIVSSIMISIKSENNLARLSRLSSFVRMHTVTAKQIPKCYFEVNTTL